MKTKTKVSKAKSNKLFAVLAAVFALLATAVWLPGLFGLESYYVESGSMAPAIPEGSMAYIKPLESIEEIAQGVDVLLFSNEARTKAFMHRAMNVDVAEQLVYTKGDANTQQDLLPTSFELCRGRVVLSVPYWGYVAKAMNSVWGKAVTVLIYVVFSAIQMENIKSKKKAVKA